MGDTRERPILFSGAMVRAILNGRKTQTRRVVDERQRVGYPHEEIERAWAAGFTTTGDLSFNWTCPYGQPGDRLWVRETWALETIPSDGEQVVWQADRAAAWRESVSDIYYLSSDYQPDRWRPSIHMPRWASRLTLEVTEVRVQRLQEISEEDAQAEGIERSNDERWPWRNYYPLDGAPFVRPTTSFMSLWDSINDERDGCAWEANPFVWAISFKVLP